MDVHVCMYCKYGRMYGCMYMYVCTNGCMDRGMNECIYISVFLDGEY